MMKKKKEEVLNYSYDKLLWEQTYMSLRDRIIKLKKRWTSEKNINKQIYNQNLLV